MAGGCWHVRRYRKVRAGILRGLGDGLTLPWRGDPVGAHGTGARRLTNRRTSGGLTRGAPYLGGHIGAFCGGTAARLVGFDGGRDFFSVLPWENCDQIPPLVIRQAASAKGKTQGYNGRNFYRGGLVQWREPEPRTRPTNAPDPAGSLAQRGQSCGVAAGNPKGGVTWAPE